VTFNQTTITIAECIWLPLIFRLPLNSVYIRARFLQLDRRAALSVSKKLLKYVFRASVKQIGYRRLFLAPANRHPTNYAAHRRKWTLPAANDEGIFSASFCEMHLLTHSYFMGRARPVYLSRCASIRLYWRISSAVLQRAANDQGRRVAGDPRSVFDGRRRIRTTLGMCYTSRQPYGNCNNVRNSASSLIIWGESKTEIYQYLEHIRETRFEIC